MSRLGLIIGVSDVLPDRHSGFYKGLKMELDKSI